MKKLCLLIISLLLLTACGTQNVKISKLDNSPDVYGEKPRNILILPPMNTSNAADAPVYYSTTIYYPLVEAGYYVFPYDVTTDILLNTGFTTSNDLYGKDLSSFSQHLDVDAILFTSIKAWDFNYYVIGSNLSVSIDCQLVSAKTNTILWENSGTIVADLSMNNSGLIAQIVGTAINSLLADYVNYAKIANNRMLRGLPYGPYHKNYMQDKGNIGYFEDN